MSQRLTALSEEAALEQLHEAGCTDGLPVVIPTPARVERMVLASGLDPDVSLGQLGPNLGEATVEKAAIAAVMAGCLPDHFPVVVAAVRAVSDPRMDMTEVQATTHNLGPLIIVNGPAVGACGVASGFGALGPGHRANASIGRAVRLAMINIGGGRPGTSDMALLGHPGKFTFCLGEDEEASPWPPLHTSLGYRHRPEHGYGGLHRGAAFGAVLSRRRTRGVRRPPAERAGRVAVGAGGQQHPLRPGHPGAGAQPRPRHRPGRRGPRPNHHRRGTPSDGLSDPGRSCPRYGPGGRVSDRHQRSQGDDPDLVVHALKSPDDLLVLVAGGTGLYSTVMPSWGAGPHGNGHITVEIDLDQACEVPLVRASQ